MRFANFSLGGRGGRNWRLISPLGATSHAFMVRVIVYSRCMARPPGAVSEGTDAGTYRRSAGRSGNAI
jgi:hypothetical protein